MDLLRLQALGAFVPAAIFKREISIKYRPLTPAETWADPEVPEREADYITESMTAHIRKRSSADFLEMVGAPSGDAPFLTVLRCVVHENGAPVFANLEQVKTLHEWILIPLASAVKEVNTDDAKKSQPRMSSGAASRSPSAAGASRSGKPRSRKKNARSG